jgi:hypothetical protein
VEVSVDRPMVPDRETESGVLVVLSAGSCTTAELAGIAQACADGGHTVAGIVVAEPVRARTAPPDGHPPHHATPAQAVSSHATGGSA